MVSLFINKYKISLPANHKHPQTVTRAKKWDGRTLLIVTWLDLPCRCWLIKVIQSYGYVSAFYAMFNSHVGLREAVPLGGFKLYLLRKSLLIFLWVEPLTLSSSPGWSTSHPIDPPWYFWILALGSWNWQYMTMSMNAKVNECGTLWLCQSSIK